jgi:hypothetical protein
VEEVVNSTPKLNSFDQQIHRQLGIPDTTSSAGTNFDPSGRILSHADRFRMSFFVTDIPHASWHLRCFSHGVQYLLVLNAYRGWSATAA